MIMIITTISNIPGKKIITQLGLVTGSTVRTTSARDDIVTGLKGFMGGELKRATKIIEEARKEATERLCEEAKAKGANAIVDIRFESTSNVFGAVEVFVYGTAVKVED